jgi:hypothetical protein
MRRLSLGVAAGIVPGPGILAKRRCKTNYRRMKRAGPPFVAFSQHETSPMFLFFNIPETGETFWSALCMI